MLSTIKSKIQQRVRRRDDIKQMPETRGEDWVWVWERWLKGRGRSPIGTALFVEFGVSP